MYNPGTGAPPQGPPQKKGKGCLIALAIAGGLGVLVAIIIVVVVVSFLHSKQGKMLTTVIGESAKIMTEAQNAPGAHELLKAGCTQGMVMDMERWETLMKSLDPDASTKTGEFPARMMVICQVSSSSSAPSCDEVKRTYLAAVPSPPGRFLAQVQKTGSSHPICANIYEPDGTFVRELKQK